MMFWLAFITHVLGVLVSLVMLLSLTKSLRGKRGAMHVGLNLDDLIVLTLASTTMAMTSVISSTWLSVIVSVFLGVYGALIWLDALLFIQYRIEINRQTLAWFFTGSKGLGKGVPHLLCGLKKFPLAAIVPILWVSLLVANSTGAVDALLIKVVPESVLWLCSITLVFLVIFSLILWLKRTFFQSQHPFLTSPSLLLNIFADDSFEVTSDVAIKTEHKKFVSPNATIPLPSPQFGELAGANIILITVESLGAYVQPYVQNAVRSRIAERMQHQSWLSKQHYCLCPNTTVSTNQMYTGAYSNNPYNKSESLFPGVEPQHVKLLKKHGYQTLFLDSADIQLYDYHKLLTRIGFDKVWGTTDMPELGKKGDYRLLNMLDEVVEQIDGSPFYLHIINDQTHMPYEVVDKSRFNRHGFADSKSVYMNAVEEVDYIIDTFLHQLGEKLDMSNTLLVFTGDHGESFGEYGYSFHSNSVIKPQMQVPFMLHHPNLKPKVIEHSCHFDLFPTFFDLLGIQCPYATLGQSLAFEQREFAYLFHSATLKGNSPANFGFMLNGDMIWMDRLFNQVSILNAEHVRKAPNKNDKDYIKTILHRMMTERGVLA